jgi:hypothetical protein
MKFTRTFALIVGAALLLSACSKEADDAVATIKANTNPLLAHVPADTAYVFAALEPSPQEIIDAYLARFQPALDIMAERITQFQSEYAAGEFEGDEAARFAAAVLEELGGELKSENLEKLGITMQAHHAFYAMGVFPTIRLGLSDSAAFRAAIGRIETKMGFDMPEKNLNGASYWSISEAGMPAAIYIAILDQQLAFSMFPSAAEDSLLPAFLGQEMPEQSLASSNALAIMNAQKGYTSYGSGFMNLQKLADEMLQADSKTHSYLGPNIDFDPASLDPVCVAEFRSIVAKAPRMTAGTTVLSANEIGVRYDLEIEDTLAAGLAALVSDAAAAEDGEHLFSASLALKIGKLRAFMLEKANALVASPYQCEKLQELNQNAAELATQLNIPMPPMVNNLLGARVQMEDFDPASDFPMGNGLLALHVDKPEMFIGTASMLIPGFDELDIANQPEPVRIPTELMHVKVDGMEVFALMGDDVIGVAMGEQQVAKLGGFLAAKSSEDGTFFSVSYDMARQMELQAAMSGKLDYDSSNHHPEMDELVDALRASYTEMLGRSRLDMRFSGDGLVIDSRMTFK